MTRCRPPRPCRRTAHLGWKLYREDRLFEAGFLGWIGVMLFATVPIRNYFPGSPPPGS